MKKLLALTLTCAAVSLVSVSSAIAATEVGNNCEGNPGAPLTVLPFEQAAGGLPIQAPAAGVVTQWKVRVAAPIPPGVVSNTMRVFRATGTPNEFQVVAETESEGIAGGVNTFTTRIPVQAGDRFGLNGTPIALLCSTGKPEDVIAYFEGNAAVGSTQTYKTAPNLAIPLVSTIEADADNDGYGDETQDKCPQSAAFQSECPTVSLEMLTLAGQKSITALVATTSKAPVSVNGTVTIPKIGKKARQTIQLSASTQTVDPGRLGRFELLFPGSLLGALKALPKKRSLTVTVNVTATDLVGRATTTSSIVQLKGQSKAKRKKASSRK